MPQGIYVIRASIALLLMATVLLAACHLAGQTNFHPITPGEAYRSAQLNQDELEYHIQRYGIRSVINLKGEDIGEQWYTDEISSCKKNGVSHYDLALAPDQAPSPEELRILLGLFKTAPRPVLIHCHAGADRSGLAAALWKMVVDGEPKSEAGKQLSIRYGHLPFGPTQALDVFFEDYR